MLSSSSSNNTQVLDHLKSSFILYLIKGKLRDYQKLLKCLNGIVIFVFQGGVGGCCCHGGWVPSVLRGGVAGSVSHTGVFPINFVSYSKDLPSET